MRASEWRYLRRLVPYVLREKGLLALTFLMGTIGFAVTFAYPWLIGQLIDDVMLGHGEPPEERVDRLLQLVGMAGLTAAFFAVAGYGRGHLNMKLGNRIVTRLRRDLFDHFQRLSLHFHARHRSGTIVNKLLHEVHGTAGLIYHGFIVVVLDVAQLVIALVLMLRISTTLTYAVLAVLPLYLLTFKIFNPRVRRASDDVHRHFGYIHGNIQEQFANVALIKTYAAERRESARFGKDVEDHYALVVKQSHVGHLMGAASELWVHLGTTIIIGISGYLVLTGVRDAAISPGQLTAFLGYTGILYGPLKRFADLNLVYQNSMSAMRRVFRAFEISPHIQERVQDAAVARPPSLGHVRLEEVRFAYEQDCDETRVQLDHEGGESDRNIPCVSGNGESRRYVLDGVTFDVLPGQTVALVGPSGSGKTTVASLLIRLYDPDHGRILLDGVDLRDYSLEALRAGIAVVQQESFIFSGTVRDNLLYGKPDATPDQVLEAAKAANAHEFISKLSNGYDTILGERGVNLSGGQKQRLSIARAILKDPALLILDEATSALDTQSERLVQQALDRLMEGRTSIIIAHRLSTIRHADRIMVMRDGRIAETGTHDELLEAGGLYAELVTRDADLADVSPPDKAAARVSPFSVGTAA